VKTYFRLLPFLKPYIWPYSIIAMVCMLAYGASDGVLPFLVQHVMDDVFARKDVVMLSYLPVVIVVYFALRGFLNFGQSYLSDYVGLRIINDVRNALDRHLQSL
jgi:subfamily B ATP-binding cassette protein MsbA